VKRGESEKRLTKKKPKKKKQGRLCRARGKKRALEKVEETSPAYGRSFVSKRRAQTARAKLRRKELCRLRERSDLFLGGGGQKKGGGCHDPRKSLSESLFAYEKIVKGGGNRDSQKSAWWATLAWVC